MTRRAAAVLLAALSAAPALAQDRIAAKPIFGQSLPNVPGKRLTAVIVDFPAGAHGVAHHHAGSVFVYVLSGSVRSQLKGGEERVYRAGETFFEPPGSEHLIGESASASEPARILAVFVADEGAELTPRD